MRAIWRGPAVHEVLAHVGVGPREARLVERGLARAGQAHEDHQFHPCYHRRTCPAPSASTRPSPTARRASADTTRTSPSVSGSRATSGATCTPSTPSPARPTTSRTSACTRGCARRSSTSGRRASTPRTRAGPRTRSSSPWPTPCAALEIPKDLLLDLLSAFRQDTVKGRYDDLGGAARLLPALGRPRRPPGAARLRVPRSRAAATVGLDLHRPAARQPLAGPGRGPAQGPHLRARASSWTASA